MSYFPVFLFICSVMIFSRADRIDDSVSYIDEVLSVYVPWAIEEAGLQVYDMPNFSNNFQNRSHDGTATTGKVYYSSGNLTGLQTVHRKMCSEPSWTSGNITTHCVIVFPKIAVKYEGMIQLLTSHSNNVRFQQRNFAVQGDTVNMEAALDVTASPHAKLPSIKSLKIVNDGTPSLRFSDLDEVTSEHISSHFHYKYNELFNDIFYASYGKAFERAVESIPYPL